MEKLRLQQRKGELEPTHSERPRKQIRAIVSVFFFVRASQSLFSGRSDLADFFLFKLFYPEPEKIPRIVL
jgi:hypothetical protein